MLATALFLCGVALGVRFSCIVLVPAIPLACLYSLFVALAAQTDGVSIAFAMVGAALAVQIGYMAGIVLHWGLETLGVRRSSRWSGKSIITSHRR